MIGNQDEVEVPLSFAQERMFILSKAEADPALYNVHRVALSRQIKENPFYRAGAHSRKRGLVKQVMSRFAKAVCQPQ